MSQHNESLASLQGCCDSVITFLLDIPLGWMSLQDFEFCDNILLLLQELFSLIVTKLVEMSRHLVSSYFSIFSIFCYSFYLF